MTWEKLLKEAEGYHDYPFNRALQRIFKEGHRRGFPVPQVHEDSFPNQGRWYHRVVFAVYHEDVTIELTILVGQNGHLIPFIETTPGPLPGWETDHIINQDGRPHRFIVIPSWIWDTFGLALDRDNIDLFGVS